MKSQNLSASHPGSECNKGNIAQVTSPGFEHLEQTLFFIGPQIAQHLIACSLHLDSSARIRDDFSTLDSQAEDSRKQLDLTIHCCRRSEASAFSERLSPLLSELFHVESIDFPHHLALEVCENWF